MKQRIYLDTSVFGGYYDKEFKEHTVTLFERIRNGEIKIIFSDLTEGELENAPETVKNIIRTLPTDSIEYVEVSSEEIDLATTYIEEKIVGKTSYDDCLHIALATIHKADYLVSWNFKHIVNVDRIRGYNSVNIKLGYKTLEIRTPRELIKYEN
jgi:predicted nucleic acid-binding protein